MGPVRSAGQETGMSRHGSGASPMRVSTVAEMRGLDRQAVDRYGIPEILLMENAGLAAFEALNRHMPAGGRRLLVIAGTGNNGGDGFVLARRALSEGAHVQILIAGDATKIRGSPRTNLDIASSLGIPVAEVRTALDAARALPSCDIVVDALFGTGLARPLQGLFADIVEAVNAAGKTVISLDIPSGINGDTGQVMGCAVRADITVTFGLPKPGNLLMPGYAHCGRLFVSHISFPPALYDGESMAIFVNEPCGLPPRDPNGHKGDFGEALFVAGARGYYGAPSLAVRSFLKAGGGYARLVAPESVVPHLAPLCPEAVFHPMPETRSGSIAASSEPHILELAGRADIVVMGPGLSLDEETSSLVKRLAARIDKPLLVDGDGITAVCRDLACISSRTRQTVLTPHAGEMSRLTGMPVLAIEGDRMAALRKATDVTRAVVVLKGAHSLVGTPDGRIAVNMSGNPGMATPGSGDVLAGAVAAMFGLGLSLHDAVRTGVFIHGAAGDLAALHKGQDGITAVDIMESLPEVMKLHREDALAPTYRLQVI